MIKVKYVWDDTIKNRSGNTLIYNKVYDVIEYNKSLEYDDETVDILCDDGIQRQYYLRLEYETYLIDVTTEYRNEIIDGILK